MKKSYKAPTVEHEEVMVEQGIATSQTIIVEEDTNIEDWKEGNTNWW